MTEPSLPEESLFAQALEIASAAERAAFLDRACGTNPALRAEIEALLRAHEQSGDLLDLPENPAATTDLTGERPGTGVGPYKLLEQIGEGGMDSVWMAEQTEPIQRRVAVKVVKEGMDSRQVLARFEAERQALALMEHPNIARVLDAGRTPSGRPYFVMELVKGQPITHYCDKERLGVRQRLELFGDVCRAVQHAHQKGIIHRDLKPSNVLVAPYDGRPVVKVIDFGVAKATGQRLTDKTLFTGFGALVGTPEYMSPEQAEVNNQDIDTRSDIYSLGVLLYELLTGSTPLTRKRLKESALLEVLRVIREEEPPRPSTRLSESKETLASISVQRQTDPAKLTRLVRGELDWIVMKALEKDRGRRYETANGFALDVQRYLADEPVQACPPSAWYRLRKFARRHRGPVLAVGIVLLALVAGIVGTAWGLVQARQAAAAEKTANDLTNKRLVQIEKGNEIMTSIFVDLNIQEVKQGAQPLEAVLAERLVTAAAQLEGDSVGEPLAVAALQSRLGASLTSLGFPDRAIPILQRSRETRQEALGPDHADTLVSASKLAQAYLDAGKPDLALPICEETRMRMAATLGPDHLETLRSMNNLAEAYLGLRKLDLAVPLFEETLRVKKAKLGADHSSTLSSMNNLAVAYEEAGKLDLAMPLKKEAFELRKAKFGPDDPATIISMNNLAQGYRAAGRIDQALPLFEESLRLNTTRCGPDHPSTLTSMNNLAYCYADAGKLDLALPLYEKALPRMKAKLGRDHPNTLSCMLGLALAYVRAGKLDLALPLLEETLPLTKAKLGPDHRNTITCMGDLAFCYWSRRELDKSIPLYESVLKQREAKLGRQDPDTLMIVNNLGVNYLDAGRLAEAIPLLEEGFRAGLKHPILRGVGTRLLDAYLQAGKTANAAALVAEMLADARRTLPPDSPQLAAKLAEFGSALLAAKAFTDAEPVLRECLSIRATKQPDAWTTFNTQSLLGGALLGQKKYAAAEPLLLGGYEGMKEREKTIPPLTRLRLAEAADRLVVLYSATNKPDELKKWQAERDKYPKANKTSPTEKK
jgi:serine/threonine protein kinase/tetratricopeptide (TPR) repeat protein